MLPDPDLPPEEQLGQDELRELLLEAIETLPTSYRAVVLLRYPHPLSFREIGQEASASQIQWPKRTFTGPEGPGAPGFRWNMRTKSSTTQAFYPLYRQ